MIGLLGIVAIGCNQQTGQDTTKDASAQAEPPQMLLKNWKPKSIFKIPVTNIRKAKYPVIDMHAHDYMKNAEDVTTRVRVMDSVGLEKSVVFTNATGPKFDSIYALYSKYPDRFDVYCGFDLTNYQESGWQERAVNELRRCVKEGAAGVGELHDKGAGLVDGLHPDDPRMDALFDACAELRIPVNMHVSDPMWMYEPMDSTNDGLIRSWTWRIKGKDTATDHAGLMVILANTIKRHPKTTFVASHLANCVYDFSILAKMLDQLPNMSADISARFAEFSTIPRTTAAFFEKYQDRLVYGTDYGWEIWSKSTDYGHNTTLDSMFRTTFRVLETNDEHFYLTDLVGYKWPMYGLGLSDATLRKIYHDNAARIRKPS
jgi:predicted TIM-barrel fold metal-dependent hydrolase